jgi:hypothetical protein
MANSTRARIVVFPKKIGSNLSFFKFEGIYQGKLCFLVPYKNGNFVNFVRNFDESFFTVMYQFSLQLLSSLVLY